MLKFYQKALVFALLLLFISALTLAFCIDRTFLRKKLLPAEESAYPWRVLAEDDREQGGESRIEVRDASYLLDYQFSLSHAFEYGYTSLRLLFLNTDGDEDNVDLSAFTELAFHVKCTPANELGFSIYAYDAPLSDKRGEAIYRIANSFFACEEDWHPVSLDLQRLEVPGWWLGEHNLGPSSRDYDLGHVASLSFTSSWESSFDALSSVKISELELVGRDWRYLYAYLVVLVVLWMGYLLWFFRQHSLHLVADVKEKMAKDRPLVAYQQLQFEPQKDREKEGILRFMATEYANEDLSLESMVEKVGVSRTRINDILKEEMGYTFSTYLNKLRLTEAARLLSSEAEANIAEIAYSVGYKNVPYFNKLFKAEYGCTPKTFKDIYRKP